ncbi:retrovirus-related Pol polyprotein from transposon opus [Trichonephila clavipes]|nr:retrovirus-related Pol polyprotein from transposon opus [Trichonephila clavipes]
MIFRVKGINGLSNKNLNSQYLNLLAIREEEMGIPRGCVLLKIIRKSSLIARSMLWRPMNVFKNNPLQFSRLRNSGVGQQACRPSISIRTFAFGTHISSQRSVGGRKKHPNYYLPSGGKVSGRLNKNLRKAHEIAAETAEATQNNYASYCNLRSMEKQFKVGDKVLVLLPSSTHKLMKTWIGPATIIEITRPYSSKVELDDGGIRELHFNKLRPYIARVGQVGLIFDQDSDFGDLHYAPTDMAVTSMGDVTDHISSDCEELEDVQ